MMEQSDKKRFLVFSDSLSCMQALSNGSNSKPLLTQCLEELSIFILSLPSIPYCVLLATLALRVMRRLIAASYSIMNLFRNAYFVPAL